MSHTAQSWLKPKEWQLLHNRMPPGQSVDEFAEMACNPQDNLGRIYRKPDLEKLVAALKEIFKVRGKFTATYAFEQRLTQGGAGKKNGALTAVTKDTMSKLLQEFLTKDLETLGNDTNNGGVGGGNNNNNNEDDSNLAIDPLLDSLASPTNNNNNNTKNRHSPSKNATSKKNNNNQQQQKQKQESGTRRTRSPNSNRLGPKHNNNNGEFSNQSMAGEDEEGDLFSAPPKNNNNNNNPLPRLSRGADGMYTTTLAAAGTSKEKASPQQQDDASSGASPSSKKKKNSSSSAKLSKPTTTATTDTTSSSNNMLLDEDDSNPVIASVKPNTVAQQQVNNNTNQNNTPIVDDTDQLIAPLVSATVIGKIMRDYPTLAPPRGAPAIDLSAIASGSGALMPDAKPYHSPLVIVKHLVHRTSVTYGTSQPQKFKLNPQFVFNAAAGDRLVLGALRAPYHNKRGERVSTLEPEHWPIPPNHQFRVEINGTKTVSTYKKNWPTSRRNDIAAPIRKSYLMFDVTDLITGHNANHQHTIRYEMCTREHPFDLCVFVIKRLPAALIVTDFLKKIQSDAVKKQEQRNYLKRFYNQALGIKEQQQENNNHHEDEEDDDDDFLEAGDPTMTLRCPIKYSTISIPVRGRHCDHVQCVDFEAHLDSCNTSCFWSCPVCDKPMGLEDIVWDPLVHRLLRRCTDNFSPLNKFDSGANKFALKKKFMKDDDVNHETKIKKEEGDTDSAVVEDNKNGEIIIGGVPAYFENMNNNNNNSASSSNPSSTRVSGNNNNMMMMMQNGNNNNNNNDNEDYPDYNTTNGKKKPSSSMVLLDSEDENSNSQIQNNINGNGNNNHLHTKKGTTTAKQQQVLSDFHFAQQLQNSQKLVRRQDSQLTRQNSFASFVVKGNSRDDAIELD